MVVKPWGLPSSAILVMEGALPQLQTNLPTAKMEFHSTGFRYRPRLVHDLPVMLYTEPELSGHNGAFLSKVFKIKVIDAVDTSRVVHEWELDVADHLYDGCGPVKVSIKGVKEGNPCHCLLKGELTILRNEDLNEAWPNPTPNLDCCSSRVPPSLC